MPDHEIVNPFTVDTANLSIAKIVDRTHELNEVRTAVLRRESVLVVGRNGVGKTCLLRKLRSEVGATRPRHLFVHLNVHDLAKGAEFFLPATVQAIFDTAWTRLFGRPPSERLYALDGAVDIEEHLKKRLHHYLQMFRILRPSATAFAATRRNDLTVAKLVGADIGESYSATRTVGDLKPNECLELAAELVDMLKEDQIDQVIVFGDEANHINPQTEIDIIKQNLEAFAARDVQFVLTMRDDAFAQASAIRNAFSCVVSLDSFRTPQHVRELLESYVPCPACMEVHVRFGDGTSEKIHEITGGHPREIQLLCSRAWQNAMAADSDTIGAAELLAAVLEVYRLEVR